MEYAHLTLLALFVFVYSTLSGRADRTPLNGALVFAGFGLVMGVHGLGLLDLAVDSEGLQLLAELTLALVLFTDAANANLGILRRTIAVPRRLLLLGLPLTIAAGFVCGSLLFPQLELFEVAVLAAMLAPTDAALGEAVVTNRAVPAYIRESLNVESGLNDGLCVPILFVFLALASGETQVGETPLLALRLVLEQLGIGLLVGFVFTLLATLLLRGAVARGWVEEGWRQLPVVSMALGCFAAAQWLGGSGFIAAFCGGLLFGFVARREKRELLQAAQGTGDLLALLTWVVFGAAVVGNFYDQMTWQVLLYAVLSLTLVRILPVYLCLAGTGAGRAEKLFVGWFGPRGLASIVFGVVVLHRHLPGSATLSLAVVCTIVLSVVAHGLSANPLAARLGRSE